LAADGEWSFAQTLRHLILATDMWLGHAILRVAQPFHPIGLLCAGTDEEDGFDMSVFTTVPPEYAEVLEVRAGRVTMVHVILREEWEHLRYAVRDLASVGDPR
jgi:hypothetical protein